jgi:hypothetical protein
MSAASRRAFTLFSFGYWGWGNETRRLVEAVDAAEKMRGFRPPVFVDARISRTVRAVGFREHAFEDLVGPDRYLWMRDLGNERVLEKGATGIRIRDPRAVEVLLDRMIELAASRRRIILFCSCEEASSCHRTTIMGLARRAALRRGLQLETLEWPGGAPSRAEARVDRGVIAGVLRGRKAAPLKEVRALGRLAALAPESAVRLMEGMRSLQVISGPLRFQSGKWCLPILRSSTFHEAAVYTILHPDKLKQFERKSASGHASEKRRWTRGKQLLEEARAEGLRMPILFADATDCSRLLYWAELDSILLGRSGTRYSFHSLRLLRGEHSPQELRLCSTGKRIAKGFIRPYALCKTPEFLGSDP